MKQEMTHLSISKSLMGKSSSTLGGAVVWSIALVLTLFDILSRACIKTLKTAITLFCQITVILLIAAAVILTYIFATLLCTAATPWFNSHIH